MGLRLKEGKECRIFLEPPRDNGGTFRGQVGHGERGVGQRDLSFLFLKAAHRAT